MSDAEAIKELEKVNYERFKEIVGLRNELRSSTLWTRIKWVFTGVITTN